MASSDEDDLPTSKAKKITTCYYEVLDIDLDATEDEIRKAYKYQALRWHPDKNQSDPDFAAEKFREIQKAFDTLSDPKKRAWYDKFRDRILQGAQELTDDKGIDIDEFLTSTCYSGYDDDDEGFYTVYRKVFDELTREEYLYQEEDDPTPPSFGFKDTPYEDVHAFYSYWSAFCTKKSFDHLMKYDVLEAPNRRVLRLMEKDNSKIRESARKTRNEAVRKLVTFVKKKDRRVLERKKQTKTKIIENRKKTEENSKKQLAERKKQMDGQAFKEGEWASMASLERSLKALERRLDRENKKVKKDKELQEIDVDGEELIVLSDATDEDLQEDNQDQNGQSKDDQDSDQEESLFCVACDKRFKSVKSFENHGRSKKHQQNVAALKKALLEDEELLS